MLLGCLIVVALGVPLGATVSYSKAQRLFGDRFSITSRTATVADRVLLEHRPELLQSRLARLNQIDGTASVLLDREYRPVVGAGDIRLEDPNVRRLFRMAVTARQQRPSGFVTPWSPRHVLTIQRVMVEGEVRGALLLRSPTGNARARVLGYWLLIALGGLLFLGIGLLLSVPFARWFLRPLRRMETATVEYTSAVLAGRSVTDAEIGGPPELRRLADSVFAMAQELARAMRVQRDFVADASHQLRNPLTALKLRLAGLRAGLAPEQLPTADAAAAEIDRLTRTLDELLVMARAEQGGEAEPVAVAASIGSRVAAWRGAAQAREVVLHERCASSASVLVPGGGLATVLDALLDNAVKFTEPGSTVEVVAADEPARAAVRIEVRDRGPGLRATELERATDRFWRSRRDQNLAGSGLGLAIVEQLVRRASGTVSVRNREGGGLVVAIELPLLATDESAAE